MASTIFTNIRILVNARTESHLLYGKDLGKLPCIENAWLLVEDDTIAAYGSMEEMPSSYSSVKEVVDAKGGLVLPAWCDSHTHIVFAGSRENEFVDKIRGLSYAEIAAKGGGILHSAARLRDTSEDELFRQAWQRLEEISRLGTGAVEIKAVMD